MRCTSCGHPNPDTAKFCSECGARLGTAESGDRRERAPRDYTPRHLADRILRGRAALEGERKQVTVLFADVKDSTELSERLDAEEWHRILDRFFQILTEGVHRFEGTVNQYTGDGIMALFGAPIAHEDHAQRACYAALWLRDALRGYAQELRRERGLQFLTRIGLHSGEVVVGRIGDDLRMDYTAQGHVVNLAQRIEQLAEPGSAYLTDATAQRVRGFFELDDLGAFHLKGIGERVPVFSLRGTGALRTRFDLSRARGLSRFVGRTDEMAILDAALAKAEGGRGSVVAVVADAGTGKTRLCYEFAERCRARGVRVYEAHCLPHGRVTPLGPIVELLRNVFGIDSRDSPEEARRKIAGTLLLEDTALAPELPIVFEFLGVPDPLRPAPAVAPEAKRARLRAALDCLTRARSAREPAVYVVEDLHWIDPESERVLQDLVASAAETRTVLVANTRPEYQSDWLWHVQRIGLRPLGPGDLEAMMRELLGDDPSVEPLIPLLRERSGGNPFFLEELVHSLLESGALEGARGATRLAQAVGDLAVPSSVQAVLAARIDRLDEDDKRLLQTAAVIGRSFGVGLLARVAERSDEEVRAGASRLDSGEFVHPRVLYPEPEYAFRHALTQEVAYASLLADARRAIHRRAAEALVELAPERHDEHAAMIAHHYDEAGDGEAALPWYRRAAERAGVHSPRASVECWERARALAKGSRDTSAELEALGQILFLRTLLGDPETASILQEVRTVAARADFGDAAPAFFGLAAVLANRGQYADLEELSREATRLAEASGNPTFVAGAGFGRGMALGVRGRVRDSLREIEASKVLEQKDHPNPVLRAGMALCVYGMNLSRAGRLEEAARALERARERGHEAGQAPFEALAEDALRALACLAGDPAAALRHAQRCTDLERNAGSPSGSLMADFTMAAARLENDEPEVARELAGSALARMRELDSLRMEEVDLLATLARAHAALGEREAALARAREAVSIAREREDESPEAPLALAEVSIRCDGAAAEPEARALLREARDRAERNGAHGVLPRVYEVEAALEAALGDGEARRRCLEQALAAAREIGAGPRAARLERELATGA